MPRVTVMIIGFNVEKYIAETLESVLAQSYADFEIVFVDDGSTDRTAEIVKAYGEKVRYCYQPNQGVSSARNHGLRESCGQYIAALDGDDCFLSDKLARQVAIMDAHPEIAFTCSDTWVMDESGKVYTVWRRGARPATFGELYRRNSIWSPTVMLRRKSLEAIGGWDEALVVSQDYDLWLRLASRAPFHHLDQPLTRYRNRPGSLGKRTRARLKDNMVILRKPEITQDKTFIEKRIRAAEGYNYFAQVFLDEHDYWMAGKCYWCAGLSYPLIGASYWPPETRCLRFTWPYRVLRIYLMGTYFLMRAVLARGHHR
jgi:glycosyltransferase involved in cell wall biosynthesis